MLKFVLCNEQCLWGWDMMILMELKDGFVKTDIFLYGKKDSQYRARNKLFYDNKIVFK